MMRGKFDDTLNTFETATFCHFGDDTTAHNAQQKQESLQFMIHDKPWRERRITQHFFFC